MNGEVSEALTPSIPPSLRWIAMPVLSVSPVIVLILLSVFFFLLPMRQEISALHGRLAAETRYQRTLSQEMTELPYLQAAKAELEATLADYRQQIPHPERLPFIQGEIEQLASSFGRVTHWVSSKDTDETLGTTMSVRFRLSGESTALWNFFETIQDEYPTLHVAEIVWTNEEGTASVESQILVHALNPFTD